MIMAYKEPLSWSIDQYIDIYAINPSDGYFVEPFNSEYTRVIFYDGTVLLVDMDGYIKVINP